MTNTSTISVHVYLWLANCISILYIGQVSCIYEELCFMWRSTVLSVNLIVSLFSLQVSSEEISK